MADPDNTFKNHLTTIKSLPGKKKAEYIWEYYKFHIIAIIALTLFVIYLINAFILNPPLKSYMNISVYGGYVDEDTRNIVIADLSSRLIPEELLDKYEIKIDNYYVNAQEYNVMQVESQKFVSNISAKNIDLILSDEKSFNNLAGRGLLLECADFLTDSLIERYSGSLVVAEHEGEFFFFGLRLGKAYFESLGLSGKGLIASIIVNSQNVERAVEALEILISE